MIKINLLPQNLRKRESASKVPLPSILFIAVLIILLLHIIFGVLGLYKKMQVDSLNRAWGKMQSQYKEIDDLKKNLVNKRDRVRTMGYVLKRDVYLTDLLSKINQAVPKGLWFNRLSFSKSGLVIEGSVFSFSVDKISLVNKFFNELKSDNFFVQNFNNFKLDSVQIRNINEYEILDFLLTAGINKERFEIEYSHKGKR